MLQGAMQAAISSCGVGVIGLPGDLAAENATAGLSSTFSFPTRQRVCPAEQEIRELADLLNNAKKVTLYCGIGAKDALPELVQLAKLLNAPVAYSFKGKMEIQYDNPNEVGMTGLLGMPSGYYSMHEAEVLVLLGTDFPYEAFMPESNTIVQVDINPNRLGRRAKIQLGLCGDVKDTLDELIPLIHQKEDDSFLREQLAKYEKFGKISVLPPLSGGKKRRYSQST